MDRCACKAAARQQTVGSDSHLKLTTLIFLLCNAAICLANYAVGYCLDDTWSGLTLNDQVISHARNMALSLVLTFLLHMVLTLLMAGYTSMALSIRSRQKTDPACLLKGFSSAGRVILLNILKALRLVLWSYLFSLPAVYVLTLLFQLNAEAESALIFALVYVCVAVVMLIVSYRYRLSYFVLMDHPEFSASQALRQATAMIRGHRMELFLLDLSFLPWILLSALTCGILLIWKLPYLVATYANVYDALTEQYKQRQERIRQLTEQQQNFPR